MTAYFSESMKVRERKIFTFLICGIKIWNWYLHKFENYEHFRMVAIFVNFQQFFDHNFRLKWNFWILMVSLERSSWDLSECILFYIEKIFFQLLKLIFMWKMNIFRFFLAVFFKLLPKFTDFINSDNCIEKSHQNLSEHTQFLFWNRLQINKKRDYF